MKEKVLVFEKSARHRFLRAVVSHFSLHMVRYRGAQTNTNRNAWEVVCGLEVTFFGFAPVCTFLRRFAPVLHIFCATFLSVWVLQKNVHPWRIAHISWQVATAQIKVGSGWQWAEEFFKCVVVSKSARFAKLCSGHTFYVTKRWCRWRLVDLGIERVLGHKFKWRWRLLEVVLPRLFSKFSRMIHGNPLEPMEPSNSYFRKPPYGYGSQPWYPSEHWKKW